MSEKKYFWNGIMKEKEDGPVLIAHKCKKCGKVYFPATTLCNACLGGEFEETELPRKGKLYSHTTTCVPIGKFPLPHAIGHIVFENEAVRIFSPLGADAILQHGDEMRMIEDVLWTEEDGTDVWGYRFIKVVE